MTTFNGGSLGSCIDEERSKLRYVMWIAGFSESSNLWTQMALQGSPCSMSVWVSVLLLSIYFLCCFALPQSHTPRVGGSVGCGGVVLYLDWGYLWGVAWRFLFYAAYGCMKEKTDIPLNRTLKGLLVGVFYPSFVWE